MPDAFPTLREKLRADIKEAWACEIIVFGKPRKPTKLKPSAVVRSVLDRSPNGGHSGEDRWSFEIMGKFPLPDANDPATPDVETFLYERAGALLQRIAPTTGDEVDLPLPQPYGDVARNVEVGEIVPDPDDDTQDDDFCRVRIGLQMTTDYYE
jgi:hypothetical protein